MQKMTLDKIGVEETLMLARPVILGSGVKGFNAGMKVTDRVVAKLRDLGFTEVWVCAEDDPILSVIEGGDEEVLTKTEKFQRIKADIAGSLADILTEKDPQREMLRIRQVNRMQTTLKKGALMKLDPERPTSEVKVIKQFSESIISLQRLEAFASSCRDLLEGPFSPGKIDSALVNLSDNRVEGSYLFNHMANCGIYFLATVARYNADLKKRGAISSEVKYSAAIDHKKRKESIFFYSDDEIISGALAAFLHDLGYLHDGMPDILFKNGIITPQEHDILKKHVEVSINLTQYHVFFASRPLSKVTIENHHERLNGRGYPKSRGNFHNFARILGMIDCFDSMTTDRPWRRKFARAKVLEWMYGNSKQTTDVDGTMHEPMFDRDLLLCFERVLMLYEVGEVVDIYHVKSPTPVFRCRVAEQNPGRPDKPIVETLHCYPDPSRDVTGKVLNLLAAKDLYLGENTDFKKEPIF